MTHRTVTSREREERRERDRQRLKQAAEQLLHSDGWRRWVAVRSKNGLARYSLGNQLLIALACPHASYVAGFRAWLGLGYQVRKGEKAIWILAKRALLHLSRAGGVCRERGPLRRLRFIGPRAGR